MDLKRTIALLILLLSTHTSYADMYDDDSSVEQDYQYPADDYYSDSNSRYDDRDYQSSEAEYTKYNNEFVNHPDGYQDIYQDDEYKPSKTKRNRSKKGEISGSAYATEDSPLPALIKPPLEKVVIVDPQKHAWGAYTSDGKLMRWGLATAGASFCRDIGRSCRTKVGTFRIYSLGDASCYSRRYPLPDGGAPMPFCMYFNGNMAIHGSNEVVYGNVSHGCVRVHVGDAEWLRYQFVEGPVASNNYRGTKVIVKPY